MRPTSRILAFTGLLAAGIAAIACTLGPAAIAQDQPAAPAAQPAPFPAPLSAPVRIATFDVFLAIELLMKQPDLDKARTDLEASYTQRLGAIERELLTIQNDLRALTPNSPQAEALIDRGEAKQSEYQDVARERVERLERLSAQHLTQSYDRARQAAAAAGKRLGYTHIFASRSADREINTENVAGTLQEILARPVLVGIPQDDITAEVLRELKIEM